MWLDLIASDAQRIGDAIDIVEPRRDERDLQNCLIVKTGSPQPLMVLLRDAGSILRQFCHIVQHHAILLRDGGSGVVLLQRLN